MPLRSPLRGARRSPLYNPTECKWGDSTVPDTGAITLPSPILSGSTALTRKGTGAINIPVAALSGTGTVDNGAITGTGAISATIATLSGTGTVTGGSFSYLDDLFPLGTEKGLLWLAADTTRLWQETSETTQADADTDPIARVNDPAGALALDAKQTTDANRPLLDITTGVNAFDLDGVVQSMETDAFTAGDLLADCSVFISLKTTDTRGVILEGQSSAYRLFFIHDGNSSAPFAGVGSPSVYYDSSGTWTSWSGSTRDDLHTDFADGNWQILEARNCDLSALTVIGVSKPTGANRYGGLIGHVIIVPTGATLTAERNNVLTQMRTDLGL